MTLRQERKQCNAPEALFSLHRGHTHNGPTMLGVKKPGRDFDALSPHQFAPKRVIVKAALARACRLIVNEKQDELSKLAVK